MGRESKDRRTRSDQGGLVKLRKNVQNHELLDPDLESPLDEINNRYINTLFNNEVGKLRTNNNFFNLHATINSFFT